MDGSVIGQIALELGVNTDEFRSQLLGLTRTTKSSVGGMSSMFSKLGGVVAGALSVRAVVSFSKACLDLGSDLAEVQNVVDVTFGSMSGAVDEWAKKAMTSYGMSEQVAKEYMGQFGAMSKAFGNTEQMAYAQATALTGLAGDVASFYNMSTDEAFTKLKAVYTGETEALKSLGVVMTQTALEEYARQRGIGKTINAMSEQEKVSLRLAFVQDRLNNASGDFARTSDGWANQTRVLSLRFDQLKATIGQGLINALTPALRLINNLMAALQRLADMFKAWTVKIFGDAGGAGTTVPGVEGSGEIADNMNSAVGSAKAYKKIMAGFDQLNIIPAPDSGGGGGGGGDGGGLDLGTVGPALEINTSGLAEAEDKFKNILGIVGMIGTALAGWKLGSFISNLLTAKTEVTSLKDAILLFGKKLTLTAGITLAISGIVLETKGIISAVQSELNKINFAEILTGSGFLVAGAALVGKFFGKIALGTGVGAIIAGIPMYITGIYDAIVNGLNLLNGLLIPIGATLAGTGIGAIIGSLGGPIGTGVGALIGLCIGLLTDFGIWLWQNFDSIESWFLGLPGWAQVVIGAIAGIVAALVVAFSICTGGVGGIGSLLPALITAVITFLKKWEDIKAFLSGIATWFYTNVVKPIIDFFTPILVAEYEMLRLAYTRVKEIVVGVGQAIWSIVTKVTEIALKIVEIFVALGKAAYTHIIQPILDIIMKIASIIYEKAIKPVLDVIKTVATLVYDHVIAPILKNLNWLRDKAIEIFKKIGTFVVEFISGSLKAVINGVLYTIENRINSFIRLLNGAISIINKIPGVSITRVQELSIPRLATGGYVAANTPQLAIIGDNKHEGEIVAPESKIADAVARGFATVMSKMQQPAGNDRPIYLTVKLGDDNLYEGFVDYHNSIVRRTGDSPLLV